MADMTSTRVNAIAGHRSNTITGYAYHGGRIECPMITQMYVDDVTHGELWTGGTPAMDPSVVPYFDCILSLYPWEEYHTYPNQEVISVEMYDDLNQAFDQVDELAREVFYWIDRGLKVLVHCQAGLNRSSLVAAIALRMMRPEVAPEDLIREMREKRDPNVLCNSAFENYVLNWKEEDGDTTLAI